MNRVLPVCPLIPHLRVVVLTQNQLAVVDAADIAMVSKHRWFAHKNKNSRTYYAHTNTRVAGKMTCLRMHRLVCGATGSEEVDHLDGNGLNNTRINLRVASHAENTRNRKRPVSSKSPYKGVSCIRGVWRARIWVNGKNKTLGVFATPEEASLAYFKAAKHFFGDFANNGM